MKRHGFIFKVLIIMFLLPLFRATPVTSVMAASEPSKEEVYKHAPKGVNFNDFLTAPSSYSNTKTGAANAFPSSNKIIRAEDSGNPSDIIQMLDADGIDKQIGSFWGTVKDDNGNKTYNYFDLSKDQTLSVWYYGGNTIDGFAFVLQNDPNGDQAISRDYTDGIPSYGQTLGVWGGSSSDGKGLSEAITDNSGGIQNSVAIEFDRYLNQNAGSKSNNISDYLDYDGDNNSGFVSNQLKENHISWGYPGDVATYFGKNYSTGILGWKETTTYNYMGHRARIQNHAYLLGYDGITVANSETQDPRNGWRHLTIDYQKPDTGSSIGYLSYHINDKFQDGTTRPQNAQDVKTFEIDTNQLVKDSSDKKVRWGFTASTGSPESKQSDFAMVIEKMPRVVDIKGTSKMTDLTRNTSVSSTDGDTLSVSDGDQVMLEQNLKYVGGISESGEITATVALPDYLDFSGDENGVIGEMNYTAADGTKQSLEINKADLEEVTISTTTGNDTDTPIFKQVTGFKVKIPSMSKIDDQANIQVYGTVKGPESQTPITTKVSGVNTSYNSDGFTGDTMSPDFTIDNEVLQITNTNDLSQEISPDETVHFKGKMSYLKNSDFDGEDLISEVDVYDQNNKLIPGIQKGNISVAKGAKSGDFDIPFDVSDLENNQTYDFKVKMTDSKGRVSNILDYQVKILDNKQLVISRNNFKTYEVFEKNNIPLCNIRTEYDNSAKVNSKDLTIHMNIDGEDTIFKLDSDAVETSIDVEISEQLKQLDYGTHQIKAWVDDGTRQSNVLDFTIKLIDLGIVLEPEKKVIDVHDNDPVPLDWTIKYSDEVDSEMLINPHKFNKLSLKIKNEDSDDYQNFFVSANNDGSENSTEVNTDSNNNYSFTLNPIESVSGVNKYYSLLKEGQNIIKFSVTGNSYHSEEKTVIINVPKLTPSISTTVKNITTSSTLNLIKVPLEFKYLEDETYQTAPAQLTVRIKDENKVYVGLSIVSGSIDYGPPLTYMGQFSPSVANMSQPDSPFILTGTVRDVYGRYSEAPFFKLDINSKLLELNVSDSRFRDINFDDQDGDFIQRDGKWDVKVNSVGTKWNLSAHSLGLFNVLDNDYVEPLYFIDKNDNYQSLTNTPTIANRDTAVSGQNKIENISDNWDDDDGIMVKNQKSNLSGEYQGQIEWTLSESIQ